MSENPRNKADILVELLSGFYMREDQEMYWKIIQEFEDAKTLPATSEEKPTYEIKHMLMGKGKTTIITPLLAFTLLFDKKKYGIDNIVIVLPNHLLEQTYNIFADIFAPILFNIKLKIMKVKRRKEDIDKKDKDEDDDDSTDEIAVRERERKREEEEEKRQKKGLSSKKSIELSELSDINKVIFDNGNDQYQNIIITDLSSLQSILLNIAEIRVTNKAKNFRDMLPYDPEKTYFIFDEIDSLANPASCELNYPDPGSERKIDSKLEDINRAIIETVKNIHKNREPERLNFEDEPDIQNIVDVYFNKYGGSATHMVKLKIVDALESTCSMIHRKDYGFNLQSPMKPISVPYSAVDFPVENSEFSDYELKICTTCFSYFTEDLRSVDESIIKDYLRKHLQKNKHTLADFWKDKLVTAILGNKSTLGFNDILKEISRAKISYTKQEMEQPTYKMNYEVIGLYLQKIVFTDEHIKIYLRQFNSSFQDVVGNFVTKYKTAFSGTNVRIPKPNDIYAVDSPSYPGDPDHGKFVFTKIDVDTIANGAMYTGMLGTTLPTDKKPKVISLEDTPERKTNFPKFILTYIVNKIISEKYDAFIDTGAFFKEVDTDKFKKSLINKGIKHKSFIYFTREDIQKTEVLNPDGTLDEPFIYYDQKHTVGTDVKGQPYNMKGLVTVTPFTTFTGISQGMYRLRQLGVSHRVDFLHKGLDDDIKSTVDLLIYLYKKDIDFVEKTESIAALQQKKYLDRKQEPGRFGEELYFIHEEYSDKKTQDDKTETLDTLYQKFIDKKYCEDDTDLCKLIKKSGHNTQSVNESKETEQEQEQEETMRQSQVSNQRSFNQRKLQELEKKDE